MWLNDTSGFVAIEEKQFLQNIKDVKRDNLTIKES